MIKVANFIINKRFTLLIIMLIIACGSIVLSTKTKTNTDMTKYLSDDSNMKQGLDIMESDFPEEEENASIRVMVDDLSPREIVGMKHKLEEIPYVDTVTYEPESKDYNKENHTLFRINTTYGYDSEEELSIEETLENEFTDYHLVFQNDDIKGETVPMGLLLAAVGMALVILVIMSASWLEPVLFMITIGIAIIINIGTNIVFSYTADLTGSIAPIIQLALSLDYSVILMSRYRQEKEIHGNKIDAMKVALSKSITSIASSSVTTIAGLLALVFLSFKLGPELGIVLAKGILISMLCVFTVLPVLILACEKGIEKTKKKSPHIPMGGLAKFSFKARFVVSILFVILFISFYMLQKNTGITFTEGTEDKVAAVFPKDNQIVLIYDNKDEGNIQKITSELEDDEHVKSMRYYTDTLGKKYNAEEMSDVIGELAEDANINKEIVSMLYYLKFNGEMPTITPEKFLHFIKKDAMTSDMLAEHMGTELTEQMDYIDKFSNKSKLTTPMTIQQMADFFELKSDEVKSLYLYYYTKKGGAATGRMKLSEFVDLILNTVAKEDAYANMFAADILSQLKKMKTYTDKAAMTKKRNYKETARLMGIDESTMNLVYASYMAAKASYNPPKMTLPEFVTFMKVDVANNSAFSPYINEETLAQIMALEKFTDKDAIQTELTQTELSAIFDMNETVIQNIFTLTGNATGTMTIANFINLVLTTESITNSMDEETINNLQMLKAVTVYVLNDQELGYEDIAGLLGMGKADVKLIFSMRDTAKGNMSILDTVNFILANDMIRTGMKNEEISELTLAQKIMHAAVSDTQYSASELASLLGMKSSQIKSLYLLYQSKHGDTSKWKLSPKTFMDFLGDYVLENDDFADSFDEETSDELKTGRKLIDAIVLNKQLDAEQMNKLLLSFTEDVSENDIELMYLYYAGIHQANENWRMTIPGLFDYLCETVMNDERFSGIFDKEMKGDTLNAKRDMYDAIAQMQGKKNSRLIITTDYPEEAADTSAFVKKVDGLRNNCLNNPSYLVGTSAMVYEMENMFTKEFTIITLITAIAIFIVVLLAFRNLAVPLLLTLLVQCGVFITVAVIGWQGGSMYYLSLLIVQSILMGATIDYGIVFCNYYEENRRIYDRKAALKAAYDGSIHTIMTSGSILVLVLAVLGMFSSSQVTAQVCTALSIGALVAVLLILIILPGMLVVFDRFIVKNKSCENIEH